MAKGKKDKADKPKHRLLIYQRIGQRLRTVPFFLIISSLFLYGLGWLGNQGVLESSNTVLLNRLWEARGFVLLLTGASVLLYLFSILIARISFVQARQKALRVRAGLVSMDFSYARVTSTRITNVGAEHPWDFQKARDRAVLRPYSAMTALVIDMRSWPIKEKQLKRLWHKYMFGNRERSLLFIVADAPKLNFEINEQKAQRALRRTGRNQGYMDPIERAQRLAQESRDRGY
ncbi:MAG: hypothetical protein GYB68_02855 [Chloroflexi bacterium]|nr:hypothetical protein [Chloroflexota bacterium]